MTDPSPFCTEQMLIAAVEKVAASPDYYVKPEELKSLFEGSRSQQQ